MCFAFLLFVDFSVSNGSQYRAEVLSCVPKIEKAVMCLMEEIRVLDKASFRRDYSAVGHEFIVTESIIYMRPLNRNTH